MRKPFAVSILFVALSVAAAAQQEEITVRWHRTAPETEAFAVLMPEPPLRVRRVIPFSAELKLATPVYELPHQGILFSVFSIEKEDVAALKTSEDFADGLRHAVRQRSSAADSGFTFEREVALDKRRGRQYRVRVGGKDGAAQVYETATHYYVLMTLGAGSSDSLASSFFNSFNLDVKAARAASDKVKILVSRNFFEPRVAPKPLWPVANSARVGGEVVGPIGPVGPNSDNSAAPSTTETAKTPASKTISGGVLNGKATSKPQPVFPMIARAARAQGTVTVQVIVDEEGYVISARAIGGHPLLQQAAVQAARQARFAPTRLEGVPIKVQGVITYNFVLEPDPSEPPTRKY